MFSKMQTCMFATWHLNLCIINQYFQYRLRTTNEKLLTGTQTVLRPKRKIRVSIFGPGHSAKTGKKSHVTRHARWNANSSWTLQKWYFFPQSSLKCHHDICHEKIARIIFEIIFLIGILQNWLTWRQQRKKDLFIVINSIQKKSRQRGLQLVFFVCSVTQ